MTDREDSPPPQRARDDLSGAALAGFLVVALVLVLLWRNPLLFWNDDYQLSILPVFADVARSWSEGNLPILSPYSWVCSNLAGEFQYGTFSIFINAAVVLIWKFPLTFAQQAAALSTVHLFVLGMGGYMLARGRKIGPALATLVALVTALNGWIVCWGATDWFGALGAFAWLPWAWWGLERAANPASGRWRFVYPAPFVYLLVAGGFPYTVVMLGLLVAWLIIKTAVHSRGVVACVPLFVGTALGFGIAAPAWLALFAYVHGSARESQEVASHFQWLVPPAALPGFIFPAWTVKWTDFSTRLMPHAAGEMTCGLVAPAALVAGLIRVRRLLSQRIAWELALLGVAMAISMLPSANVFRWSFRWLPFLHVIMALCAAESLQMIARHNADRADARWKEPAVIALALLAITTIMMWIFGLHDEHGSRLAIAMFGIAALWLIVGSTRSLTNWSPAVVTAATLLATYICVPTNCGVPRYDLSQQLAAAAPLDQKHLYFSVYPAAENFYRIGKREGFVGQTVRLGSTSMWAGVRLINGYSPIRPAGVARKYNFGIHGEVDYDIADALLGAESGSDGELARLGVDGIIVARDFAFRPQPDSEWAVANTSDEGTVYHRVGPPAGSVRSISSEAGEAYSIAEVSIVRDSRNGVVADVSVPAGALPARVVFSRSFFPGYHARIGNTALPVKSYRGLAPAVEIPAGSSGRLTLSYAPSWLTIGAAGAATSVLILVAAIAADVISRRRARS